MTREIKFRGKDISNGSWRYGYYFSIKRNGRHFIKHPELFNDYEVDQSSVGQFTGLKDKNGVDIYEGDIVLDPRYPDIKFIVVFDWYWTDNSGDIEQNVYGWQLIALSIITFSNPLDTIEKEYKVVGNIH